MWRRWKCGFSKSSANTGEGTGDSDASETVPDYDEWYNSIFSSISDWVGSVLEGLATPFEGIAQGIVNLGNHFSNILDYLNPFSDNFILKNVIDFLGNILNYINPFSEDFFGKKIVEMFSSLFEYLFIPTEDHFSNINTKINEKFGFVEQIKQLVSQLFSTPATLSEEEYPTWEITYEGTTVNIVDFTAFDKFRGILHTIIIGVMYISFLLRFHRRIPGIIGGFHVEEVGGGK